MTKLPGPGSLQAVAACVAVGGGLLVSDAVLGSLHISPAAPAMAFGIGICAVLGHLGERRLRPVLSGVFRADRATAAEVTQLRIRARDLEAHNEQLEQLREQLEWQVSRDAVTGLLSRRAITERAEAELQRARRAGVTFTLIVLDVDRLKSINDRYGHLVGDQILCEVGRRLELSSGVCHSIGRWGGDEFLVVLSGPSPEMAEGIGRRLGRSVAAEPIRCRDELRIDITVSIGLGSAEPHETIGFNELFHRADMAMYEAKQPGSAAVMRSRAR